MEVEHFKILVLSGSLAFVKRKVLVTNLKESTKRLEIEWTTCIAVRGTGEERKERWKEKPLF